MSDPPRTYRCPGESFDIPRAVHLSRLASFYAACRDCEHRRDTGPLPAEVVEQIEQFASRAERASLFHAEGVRGVYLNELDRARAGRLAAAFAGWLRSDPLRASRTVSVVLGHDERPAAPDLALGIGGALRRMGCEVVDLGRVSPAVVSFAVRRRGESAAAPSSENAAWGMAVHGGGCGPAEIGISWFAPGGELLTVDSGLNEVAAADARGAARPEGVKGGYRTASVLDAYCAWLAPEFHALRPLRIALGCASRPALETLERCLAATGCERIPVELPVRARDLADAGDPDPERIRRQVAAQGAHLGYAIDADGQACALIDERGELVPLCAAAAELERLGYAGTEARGARLTFSDVDAPGVRVCDALLSLARLLQALSRSDAEASRVFCR